MGETAFSLKSRVLWTEIPELESMFRSLRALGMTSPRSSISISASLSLKLEIMMTSTLQSCQESDLVQIDCTTHCSKFSS
jgi:hypothetical protein